MCAYCYGPLEAVGESLRKTWEMSTLMLRMLGKMVIGEASLQNINGPISIAEYAGRTASYRRGRRSCRSWR